MKPLFTKLVFLIALSVLAINAQAQRSAVPDTTRYTIGLNPLMPAGKLNNGYLLGLGVSAQVDIPVTLKWYFTANVGYNTFFPQHSSSVNDYAILNVKVPAMDELPIKVGFKYFLIRTFYLQGEVGESLLLNKTALYAYEDHSLTFAPQMGLLFKLPNRRYIDAGFRWEWFQDVYSNNAALGSYNKFWAFRIAYGFNLTKPQ